MAPEVVKQTAYTRKADIWSVGCLIVEMLTGEHPWAQLSQMQAIFKVRANPAHHSAVRRLCALQILMHSFFPDRFFRQANYTL